MEVSEHLVGSAAFNAVGTGTPRPAGSIPVHLRHLLRRHRSAWEPDDYVGSVTWRLAEGVRWVEVDDGAVIFCAANGGFVDLADSAAELWAVLQQADWAEKAAVHHLVDTYVVAEADAHRIVADFMAALERYGVLSDRAG